MTPALIELMIDRLCGMYPTTNIARNTVKNAWVKDELLLDASEEDAKQVLKMSESLGHYPNQFEIKSMFNKVMGVRHAEVGCDKCDSTGFVYTNPNFENDSTDIRYVKSCDCRSF
jgi:hypothetical protein